MAIKNILDQNENIQPNTELLQTLQKFLPQYFDTEGNFKEDKFEAELKANNISEARDGYRLGFVGKDYARLQTGLASETVIVPDMVHNTLPENANSQNVFITGDNLEALRHLQNAYAGKIKMIYIDPPYNTGKGFVYNDKFDFSDEKLKTALGYTNAEIERLKSIQGKSSHSAWLTFMYPRLKIAQKLLTDAGVIFVSIDDNEQANLKLLMDDIFGEGNFVAEFIWKRGGGRQDSEHIAIVTEYTICYSRNYKSIELGEALKEDESYPKHDDEKNKKYKTQLLRKWGANSRREDRPNLYYPIKTPDGADLFPITNVGEGCWRWGRDKMNEEIEKGNIEFEERDGIWVAYEKIYEGERNTKKFTSLIDDISSANGTKQLKEIMNGDYFDYPKPIDLIKRFLEIVDDKDTIILDFFAGSATTAHAVIQFNAEDQGNRKYIMVQWDEPTNENSEARKAGYETIDEISRERIKRASNKIKSENPLFAEQGDLGFKHYRLVEPDVQTLDKIVEFSPNENKLFEDDMISPFAFGNESGLPTIVQTWLIQDGYDFNTKIKTLKLSDYEAVYVKESATLYLINTGFSHDALKDLLNKIGKNELTINTIIVYPYSFAFEQMRELKNNLKTNVEAHITIIERY